MNFRAFFCNDMHNTLKRIFIFRIFDYRHYMIFKNNTRQVASICKWN